MPIGDGVGPDGYLLRLRDEMRFVIMVLILLLDLYLEQTIDDDLPYAGTVSSLCHLRMPQLREGGDVDGGYEGRYVVQKLAADGGQLQEIAVHQGLEAAATDVVRCIILCIVATFTFTFTLAACAGGIIFVWCRQQKIVERVGPNLCR